LISFSFWSLILFSVVFWIHLVCFLWIFFFWILAYFVNRFLISFVFFLLRWLFHYDVCSFSNVCWFRRFSLFLKDFFVLILLLCQSFFGFACFRLFDLFYFTLTFVSFVNRSLVSFGFLFLMDCFVFLLASFINSFCEFDVFSMIFFVLLLASLAHSFLNSLVLFVTFFRFDACFLCHLFVRRSFSLFW
jgi:hypothetical protein